MLLLSSVSIWKIILKIQLRYLLKSQIQFRICIIVCSFRSQIHLTADSFGHGVWSLVHRDPVSGSLCIWHIVKYFTGLIQVKLLSTSYSGRWYVYF